VHHPSSPPHIPLLLCLVGISVGALSRAAAPDGGPWAPVIFDAGTVKVTPRTVAPGEAITVSFSFRSEQAARIRELRIESKPRIFDVDAKPGLDLETGKVTCIIPGRWTALLGTYEIRVPMVFEWTDGKTYTRSPPFGHIRVVSNARHTYTDASFESDVQAVEKQLAAARAELAKLDRLPKLAPLLVEIRTAIEAATDARRKGDDAEARTRLTTARADATQIAGRPLLAEYRFSVKHAVATLPKTAPRPLLSIMTGGWLTVTDEQLETIRELGIDTITPSTVDEHAKFEDLGLRTMVCRAPVRFTEQWTHDHPEGRQHRYLLSDATIAETSELSIDPLLGFVGGHYDLDTATDVHRYWRVVDETTGTTLPAHQWTFDPDQERVLITGAHPGHAYRVAALVQAAEVPFFHRFADPLDTKCRRFMMRRIRGYLVGRPGLDIYRPTSLYYPFPKIDKLIPTEKGQQQRSWHNFYGYQWGTSPMAQQMFTKQTGIPFDPLWMTDGGRYGDVNYPPRPEYLPWMRFQQDNVNRLTKQVVDIAHAQETEVRVFWGDHWMGMEPHGEFFQKTGCDQIVKACKSAVVVRMTVDGPADAKRIIRFSPWFSWGELFGRKHPIGFMDRCWRDIKRGALFRVPDGFTWGGDTNTIGFQQPGILRKMREMSAEFQLIHALTKGHEVYRHDLNLYVVNAWGSIRPWCGWLQVNDSQKILTHLTDLPVNVHFVSIAEIAENGVPADAHVLLNAGEPHSSWSGGFHWQDGRAAAAIRSFVNEGGGLIGIGAPSHSPTKDKTWLLADLLGVDFADSVRPGEEDRASFSTYDAVFLKRGPKPTWTAPLRKATPHWLTSDLPAESSPILTKVIAKAVLPDVTLICTGRDGAQAAPIVTVRSAGKGRTVYLNGYSTRPDYGTVLRRAAFWACNQEATYDTLRADSADVVLYYYPSAKLLAAYNTSTQEVTTRIHVARAVTGHGRAKPLAWQDAVTDQLVTDDDGKMVLEIPAGAIRFLTPRSADAQ
jgi:1,3-beta-galactosyl-N-acetylhexosamine phosphorylase